LIFITVEHVKAVFEKGVFGAFKKRIHVGDILFSGDDFVRLALLFSFGVLGLGVCLSSDEMDLILPK
jgi:hypothetical protein